MGNLIVLHGMGFHALQTLIIPAWLLEKTKLSDRIKRLFIHYGSISWTLSIIFIGFQTSLDRTVFELTALPIIASVLLVVWLCPAVIAFLQFIKSRRINPV